MIRIVTGRFRCAICYIVAMTDAVQAKPLRLFVAIDVPETVREKIATDLRPLKHFHHGIRWTPEQQWHLTLKFLGNVEASKTPALTDAVRKACASVPALPVTAHGFGFFPNDRNPHVLWIGIHGLELGILQRAIATATEPFSQEADADKPFHPHLTLARFNSWRRIELERLKTALSPLQNKHFGEWTTNEVLIMQSELGAGGATHTLLSACQLM